jgi:mono/diheme cytochrome c family protein
MTRQAVNAPSPASVLQFPYSIRQAMAGWDLLFLKKGPLQPVADQSDEWNRGRYLAEGLGHCAACHTPRNQLGAEDSSQQFAGGSVIDGWYVYPLDKNSPAPTKWDVASLTSYLKHGFAQGHGAAAGPMAQVTANLAGVNDADVKAIATYVASQMGVDSTTPTPAPTTMAAGEPSPPLNSGDSLNLPMTVPTGADIGQTVFATACSSCHTAGRAQPFGGVDLRQSSAVNADSPQNVVNMVLYGLPASDGKVGPIMPSFAGALDQGQLVALLGYLRSGAGKSAWSDAATVVADTLSGKTAVKSYSADGIERVPGAGNARTTP